MADLVPELEDGELYLPAGILLGEDGLDVGSVGGGRSRGPLRRQSLFSDRVGGFVCYRPELGRGGLVGAAYATMTMGEDRKTRVDFSAAHLPQWLWKGCLRFPVAPGLASSGCACGGHVSSPAPGRVILASGGGAFAVCSRAAYSFPPVRSCDAQVEGDARVVKRPSPARLLPTAASGAGRECGGTGFFFPLYRFQNDSRRPPSGKGDRDGQKQKLYAVVAKKGMPLQPRTEMGLPQDWTY